MLIKCPECELQVSDKAVTCPHCGYPLQPDAKPRKSRKSNKRRRLPNGFGQISEIKNRNLRKPFRAMVTVGKDANGRPICKPLKPDSYFATYNDAYAALVEYNKNPYDLAPAITVKELYERWSAEYFKPLKPKSAQLIETAWNYCSSVYGMRVCDVRARHIKGCIENGTAMVRGKEHHTTPALQQKIKSLFNILLDYAVEYEIVDRNYARTFTLDDRVVDEAERNRKEHIPFTDEEMALLWENINDYECIDILLIQCYSGWRPNELGLLELSNVDLENWTFQGGSKTTAGQNRIVPIHSRIRPLVVKRYEEAQAIHSKYLFNCSDSVGRYRSFTYACYNSRFNKIRDGLNLNPAHRPHDGRKHFVTMAKKYNVDEYAIKYIVGHAITDITEKVYTQRDTAWLQAEIEKIR